MSKKFRAINASFKEPKTLAASTCIGAISLAAGASFFGLSTIKIGVDDDKNSTYHISFMVVEDTDSAYNLVKHDVVLVKDLTQFEFDGSALLLGDLRKQGNCGGHVMLVSHSSAHPALPRASDRCRVYLFRTQQGCPCAPRTERSSLR